MRISFRPFVLSSFRRRRVASRASANKSISQSFNKSILRAFTLFEALIALAIFAIAFVGLVVALDASVRAAIEARNASVLRRALEDRLAYNLVVPLQPGETRTIAAKDNNGIAIEETIEAFEINNMDDVALTGLWLITIKATTASGATETIDTLVYRR